MPARFVLDLDDPDIGIELGQAREVARCLILADGSGRKATYPSPFRIAAFEPRSNTSRRAFFQESYAASFGAADAALIVEVANAGGYSGTSGAVVALDVKRLVNDIRSSGTDGFAFPDVPALERYLLEQLTAGDVAVLMSNGDFGGLVQSLPAKLAERVAAA